MKSASMSNWSIQASQELSDEQFQDWKLLVEEKTGMLLPYHRKTFLQSSLNIRMREINCENYDEYFEQLVSGMSGRVEWAVLVDRLTVHETNFFRHRESFDLVRNYLRGLMLDRVKQNKAINIWSVGCSTGEEPYSLMLLMEELMNELQLEIYYGVTATDISLTSLSVARTGKYKKPKLSNLNSFQKSFIFDEPIGEQFQIKQKYKDKVCFARVNLLGLDEAAIERVDVLFCQNVLIYFQKERKYEIVEKLSQSLEPGGLMVLGLGDLTDWCPPSMQRVKEPNILAFTKNS